MTPARAGLWLALAHTALVASLGFKLMVDRARLPHGWARTQPFDPSTPLRGRYVRLGIEVPLTAADPAPEGTLDREVRLAVRDGRVVAIPTDSGGTARVQYRRRDDRWIATLAEPIAFFIPEHVSDPSRRPTGEELWVEVTLPGAGPPRPIRLGVMRDGRVTPLQLR